MASTATSKHPRVSIFMPTYNHARFIQRAIEGVISQETDFPYVLQLGDDCSTDGTREICTHYAERYPEKIVMQQSGQRLGALKNGLRLCHACQSEFMAMCEGDDVWTSCRKLQLQVDALDAHPNWSACFHRTRVKSDDESVEELFLPPEDRFLPQFTEMSEVSLKDIASDNFIATCSIVYRRTLVPEIPEWIFTLLPVDWQLHMFFAAQGPVGYLEQELAVYHQHSGGVWSTLPRVAQLDQALKMHFEFEKQFEEPTRSIIAEGRREFLKRTLLRQEIHSEELKIHFDGLKSEVQRLGKIESRYRALQLHRVAAIGKWVKQILVGDGSSHGD